MINKIILGVLIVVISGAITATSKCMVDAKSNEVRMDYHEKLILKQSDDITWIRNYLTTSRCK
jgi:hypothetical protein